MAADYKPKNRNNLHEYRLPEGRKSIDHYNFVYNRFIPFMST